MVDASTMVSVPTITIDTNDLVDSAEIVKRYGVTFTTFYKWSAKEDFPRPLIDLSMGKAWSWTAVKAWYDARPESAARRPRGERKQCQKRDWCVRPDGHNTFCQRARTKT